MTSRPRDAAFLLALMDLPGVGPAGALRVARGELPALNVRPSAVNRWQGEIDARQRAGVTVLTAFDERWPRRLERISGAPAVLWVRGNVDALSIGRSLAVVGTRQPSAFGSAAIDVIAGAACRAGWSVVSGLARGCDRAGHEVALREGAPTVALLGCGIDLVTPQDNRPLADRILAAGGALASEMAPWQPPSPASLVARNRLQSGLSAAVLVAQTAVRGGTPHTARFAAAQGRPVYCPAPPSDHPASEGLHVLLGPARDLPRLMPAFRSAEALCQRLGDRPLARPATRERVAEWLEEIEQAAASIDADEPGDQPQQLALL